MSKTIEEIKTKELLGKVALANGYSCIAEMSVTMSDKDIRIAVLKYQLDESQSQTKELQEQNAELVDLVERCKDVIYAYNDYKPTATGNEILQAIQERLTKYNHLKSNTNDN